MDDIKSQLDNLSELSNEQVGELEASIVSQFDTFDNADALTSESVDAMTELADMLESVRGEVSRREAQSEELTARKAELSSRVHGSTVEAPGIEEVLVEPAVTASATDEEAEASVSDETISTPAETTEASVEEALVETPVEAEAAIEEVPVAAEASAADETTVVEPAPETEAAAEEVVDAPVDTVTEASAEEAAPKTEASVEAPAEATADAPIEAEASITENEPQAQEEAHTVTATAGDIIVPADRLPVAQETEAPAVAITAGADLPSVGAGQSIKSMNEVAKHMADRLHSLRRVNGGDGEQVIVASLNSQYSEDRILEGTPEENWAKVTEAKASGALVASGGRGTPVETRYDIFGFGTDARPVKDSLPKFQANRGGVRFVRPPVLSSYAGATGVWTEANDLAAAGGTPVKNSLTVAGATEAIAMTDAITLQLKFGNLLSRAYPELVARHNELALVQHAREAERNLLARIAAASTAVTTASVIGFARDFLVNVRLASTAYRSRHRIDPETQLQAIIPMWVIDAMAADLALNMPGDGNLSVAKAEISGMLANLNVSLTASYDQNTFGAQSAGALLEFPDSFTWFLFSEGSFLFLDGGTLDIGIVRDSGLVNTNDYKMFIETFEGVAFVGIESLAITSTIAVNGAAAALRDTLGGVVAATVEY